jgi:hypothetical protein
MGESEWIKESLGAGSSTIEIRFTGGIGRSGILRSCGNDFL